MREIDLGDLGLNEKEQELLSRAEGRRRLPQRQMPLFTDVVNNNDRQELRLSWVFAVVGMFLIALLLGTMYQDDAANRGARAAAGPPQTTASVQQQTDPAAAYARYNRGVEYRQRDEYADAYTYRENALAEWEADGSRIAEPNETGVITNLAGAESPSIENAPAVEVHINYALYVEAVNPWTDTQIPVHNGDVVTIRATGTIHPCIWNNCRDVRFNRWISARGFVSLPYLFGFPSMALVGRIANSNVFLVGESASVVSPLDGILYLGVNDIPNSFSDNAGRFTVTVTISSRAD